VSEVGEALFRELLWVHDAIRRDLGTVRTLAEQPDPETDDAPSARVSGS
jgi:hypothetical protein